VKAIEKIVTGDDGERLQKCVVELESENCKLKAAATEAAEDYEVLQLANTSLLDEHNNSCYKCKDLEVELKKVHSDSL
jgi:FtsZ-binding cell division protein ZapB